MINKILVSSVNEKISELQIKNTSIVVLKGISVTAIDSLAEKVRLSDVISNKLGYFISIYGKRNYLSYEEFLLLSDFVVSQYKEIYILNNNLYIEQYPIEEIFDDDVRKGLLNHFTEAESDEVDDAIIGDIDEYISIFQGLKENNGTLIGAYTQVPALQNSKIEEINIFQTNRDTFHYTPVQHTDFYEIVEESDYVEWIEKAMHSSGEIYIRISNYANDVTKLKEHLSIINTYWNSQFKIFCTSSKIRG